MKELYLIRHGKTYGNTLGRYIGTTDEPLCEEGREALQAIFEAGLYPMPDVLYGSPLKRCQETAAILFPGKEIRLASALRECDFGEFENKNYKELSGNAAYQAWLDSNGTLPFPGGESREGFEKRCREGFAELLNGLRDEPFCRAAFVVHGGTIMSILSAYAAEKEEFYHWQVKNGEGFRMLWDETEKGGIILHEISHLCPDTGLSAGSDLR